MTPIYLSFMFVQEMKMHEELVSTANELQKVKFIILEWIGDIANETIWILAVLYYNK